MIDPSVDDLLEKYDSRFSLIISTSQRARQLIDGAESLYDKNDLKPVSIAVKEISDDLIKYKKPTIE
jgi:DNA-directed RNA polymerase subunit omega